MNDTLKELLTQDNITLALSIFGSLGTIITIVSKVLVNRKNLSFSVASITYRYEKLYINMSFINKSRLPISIISVSLKVNNHIYESVPYPENVGKHTLREGKEIVNRIFMYNILFPLSIGSLNASSGFIAFDVSKEAIQSPSAPLTLLIHSTRGLKQKVKLAHNQIDWF